MTTFRACYFQTADHQGEILLTEPEHAGLDDAALEAEAEAFAERAGLLGDSAPRLTLDELRAGLVVGDWTAR
jgi:uncharacterized protein YdgA (DUF945 family)